MYAPPAQEWIHDSEPDQRLAVAKASAWRSRMHGSPFMRAGLNRDTVEVCNALALLSTVGSRASHAHRAAVASSKPGSKPAISSRIVDFDRVSDPDRPLAQNLGAQAAAMDQSAFDPVADQFLKMRARLAQPDAA